MFLNAQYFAALAIEASQKSSTFMNLFLECNFTLEHVLFFLLPSYQFSNTHDLLGRISMDSITMACVYRLDLFLCYLPDTFQLASSSLFPSCCRWQVTVFYPSLHGALYPSAA